MAGNSKGAEPRKTKASLGFQDIARTMPPVSDMRRAPLDRTMIFIDVDIDGDPSVKDFRDFLSNNAWVLFAEIANKGGPYLDEVTPQTLYEAHCGVLGGGISGLQLMRLTSYETRPVRNVPKELLSADLRLEVQATLPRRTGAER